jgi:hypothetical protein
MSSVLGVVNSILFVYIMLLTSGVIFGELVERLFNIDEHSKVYLCTFCNPVQIVGGIFLLAISAVCVICLKHIRSLCIAKQK